MGWGDAIWVSHDSYPISCQFYPNFFGIEMPENKSPCA